MLGFLDENYPQILNTIILLGKVFVFKLNQDIIWIYFFSLFATNHFKIVQHKKTVLHTVQPLLMVVDGAACEGMQPGALLPARFLANKAK